MASTFKKQPASGSEKPTSIILLRWLGYALLAFTLIDLASLFYPPNFMNPGWEFQTAGAVVDRIAIPLLAFGLIFFGEINYRKSLEVLLLKILSWLTPLIGLVCLILIPLVLVTNAQRLAQQLDIQASNQFNQNLGRLEQAEETVTQTSGDDLVTFLESQGATINDQNPQAVKEELLTNLSNTKQQLKSQTDSQLRLQKIDLKKNAIKWGLGSVVAGILFAYMWVLTKWARQIPLSFLSAKKRGRKQRSF